MFLILKCGVPTGTLKQTTTKEKKGKKAQTTKTPREPQKPQPVHFSVSIHGSQLKSLTGITTNMALLY